MARIPRPIFRLGGEYVAVKPIRLHAGKTIEPGEDVKLKKHQLRSLYQRLRIGPKGHPWTEQAIEARGYPKHFITDNPPPQVERQSETFEGGFPIRVDDDRHITADEFSAWVNEYMSDADAYGALDDNEKQELLGDMIEEMSITPEAVEPERIGSQWGFPSMPDAPKFTSRKKARQWLSEQEGE
jgi:hypothetical protein